MDGNILRNSIDWQAKKCTIDIESIIYIQVPNLRDLMSDALRWSWYNNNRNEVRNKCNVLELSWNQPLPLSMEKLSSTKPVSGDNIMKIFLFATPSKKIHGSVHREVLVLPEWASMSYTLPNPSDSLRDMTVSF